MSVSQEDCKVELCCRLRGHHRIDEISGLQDEYAKTNVHIELSLPSLNSQAITL